MTDSEAREAVEFLQAIQAADTLTKLGEIERRIKSQPYARNLTAALESRKSWLLKRNRR